MMAYVRIRLDQMEAGEPPLIINLDLGPDRKISQAVPFSGWWGVSRGDAWCMPLVFRPDGKVDYGSNQEEERGNRYSEMQIFGRAFELGERFYLKHPDGAVVEFLVRDIVNFSEPQ